MHNATAIAIGVVFGVIGLILVFAFGVANKAAPTLAIGNVDAPADEECATFENSSSYGIEWQACSAAANTIEVYEASTAVDTTAPGFNVTTTYLRIIQTTTPTVDVDTSTNWPTADAADALSSDPTDCAANRVATAIGTAGDLTCVLLSDGFVPDTITIDLAATATALASDPSDCTAPAFAQSIDTAGDLTCDEVEQVIQTVRNESGGDMNKGDLVYVSGYSVGQDVVLVDLADADAESTMPVEGIVFDTTISNNATGRILVFGQIGDLDTSACSVGSPAYASSTAGAFTCTQPTGTVIVERIGTILRSNGSAGRMEFLAGGNTDTVPEALLGAIDTAADEECLTYESSGTSPFDLEWQSCGGSASIQLLSASTEVDTVSSVDFTSLFRLETNSNTVTVDWNQADTPADEECATYESSTTNIEWQSCGGLSSVSIYDDSTLIDSVASIDFGGALTVATNGSTVTVDVDTSGTWTGNAATATALASDPADCSGVGVAIAINASGDLSCVILTDSYIPNTITIDLAATATALASNPADCEGVGVATTIAASGDLTCTVLTDAYIPNTITVDLASTATALAANPADCAGVGVAITIAASGDLTCTVLTDAYIPDTITIDLAATATALASNPTDCTNSGDYAHAIAASGNLTCVDLPMAVSAGLSSVSADDDDIIQIELAKAASIAAWFCSTDTGTVTVSVDRRSVSTPNSAGDTVFSSLGCSSTRARTTSFTFSTITTDYLWNVTIDAVSGTGQIVRFGATGTYDE